jgi:hypothetical protein
VNDKSTGLLPVLQEKSDRQATHQGRHSNIFKYFSRVQKEGVLPGETYAINQN